MDNIDLISSRIRAQNLDQEKLTFATQSVKFYSITNRPRDNTHVETKYSEISLILITIFLFEKNLHGLSPHKSHTPTDTTFPLHRFVWKIISFGKLKKENASRRFSNN